ncbi:MAG: hypothetical protein ACLQEI_06830 [Terriglobales bacterium]
MTRVSRKLTTPSPRRQNISPEVWYYEEGRHLSFVVSRSIFKNGEMAATFEVPLHRLEKTLARSPRKQVQE